MRFLAALLLITACRTGPSTSLDAHEAIDAASSRDASLAIERDARAVSADASPAIERDAASDGSLGPDAGECADRCADSSDCGGLGWRCEPAPLAGCTRDPRRCVSDCRRYPGPYQHERCCVAGERVEHVCTPERGFECPAGAARFAPEDVGAFSAGLFGCGALAAESEPGVPCQSAGDEMCTLEEQCCASLSNFCEPRSGTRSCYATTECDGPEDCASGALCCGAPSLSYEKLGPSASNPISTTCATSCAAPHVQLCNADSDCPGDRECCPRAGRRIGLCALVCPR